MRQRQREIGSQTERTIEAEGKTEKSGDFSFFKCDNIETNAPAKRLVSIVVNKRILLIFTSSLLRLALLHLHITVVC